MAGRSVDADFMVGRRIVVHIEEIVDGHGSGADDVESRCARHAGTAPWITALNSSTARVMSGKPQILRPTVMPRAPLAITARAMASASSSDPAFGPPAATTGSGQESTMWV